MLVLLVLCGVIRCQATNLLGTEVPADEVIDEAADRTCSLMLLQQSAATTRAARAIEARESPLEQSKKRLTDLKIAELASGFAGRPAEDTWSARWEDVVRKGTEQQSDPCAAEILSFASAMASQGIGSQLHGRILEYMSALYFDLGLSMLMDSMYHPEVLENNFDNPGNISICRKMDPDDKQKLQRNLVIYAAHDFILNLGREQRDYAKRLMRFVAPYVLTYKADIQAELDRRMMSMGLGTAPYIGVHIRHGDKKHEAATQPTSKYTERVRESEKQQGLLQASVEAVRMALEQTGASIVFLATDDDSAVSEMQQALGANVEVKMQTGVDYGRGYDQGEALIDFLTDVEGLRRSDVFICTGSSNVAKIVWAMRPGKPNDEDIVNLEDDPSFPLHFFR